MSVKGTFEITMAAEPPYSTVEGVSLSRARFDKVFSGPLSGKSEVNMLAARTADPGSAGYVATERIEGTVDGKTGSFVVLHTGVMDAGARSLAIVIVPGSGTGELAGITGRMDIQIVDGQHFYELDYTI
jgi:hypothetical protein